MRCQEIIYKKQIATQPISAMIPIPLMIQMQFALQPSFALLFYLTQNKQKSCKPAGRYHSHIKRSTPAQPVRSTLQLALSDCTRHKLPGRVPAWPNAQLLPIKLLDAPSDQTGVVSVLQHVHLPVHLSGPLQHTIIL